MLLNSFLIFLYFLIIVCNFLDYFVRYKFIGKDIHKKYCSYLYVHLIINPKPIDKYIYIISIQLEIGVNPIDTPF
jgi:hypothetical protein